MKIHGLKLSVNLETHPDAVSGEMWGKIEALPGYEEADTFGDVAYAIFWLSGPEEIEPTLAGLRFILNLLL